MFSYKQQMTYLVTYWLTGYHFLCKLSAVGQPSRPTQPSIPPGVGR